MGLILGHHIMKASGGGEPEFLGPYFERSVGEWNTVRSNSGASAVLPGYSTGDLLIGIAVRTGGTGTDTLNLLFGQSAHWEPIATNSITSARVILHARIATNDSDDDFGTAGISAPYVRSMMVASFHQNVYTPRDSIVDVWDKISDVDSILLPYPGLPNSGFEQTTIFVASTRAIENGAGAPSADSPNNFIHEISNVQSDFGFGTDLSAIWGYVDSPGGSPNELVAGDWSIANQVSDRCDAVAVRLKSSLS